MMTWKDGDQYVADFKAGMRNGNGTQTLAKVAKISGRWVDGKYAGLLLPPYPGRSPARARGEPPVKPGYKIRSGRGTRAT
jgi:hypothetical protein